MFQPKYAISDFTTTCLTSIERLTVQLEQSIIPEEVLAHIKQQCLVALTHFSTQIEGNKLSMEQVSGVVEKHRTFGLVRDEKEVKNYFILLGKTTKLISQYKKSLTHDLILHCHSNLLNGIAEKNVRGTFRNVQNAIYEAQSGNLIYLPPEPKDVTGLVSDLCHWMRGTSAHPLVMAAIFHNQFVTIHPFVDGNGRSARFLSLYLLEAKSYDWKKIVPIDRYYADDRGLYYQMLQQHYSPNYYHGRHDTDFTPWVEYYITGIRIILEGTLNQVALYRAKNILMNNRQMRILKYLAHHKYIVVSQYAKRFSISTRMATRDLRQLVDWGYLAVFGQARATKYFLK
ncbi:MAG: hypothetical protein A3I69_09470 [Deltaproteobacteria bacterium RIFCSPLOWO2_02_FULL_40_36]|nr:MAG: hypothetical protein A3I69_09470 [Deltaproteobacteria bacterium RIFCSPLOWO2_02_FULL_40_36]